MLAVRALSYEQQKCTPATLVDTHTYTPQRGHRNEKTNEKHNKTQHCHQPTPEKPARQRRENRHLPGVLTVSTVRVLSGLAGDSNRLHSGRGSVTLMGFSVSAGIRPMTGVGHLPTPWLERAWHLEEQFESLGSRRQNPLMGRKLGRLFPRSWPGCPTLGFCSKGSYTGAAHVQSVHALAGASPLQCF